jgi:hypothetical protein
MLTYLLVGAKIDEETGEEYETDMLYQSDEPIKITQDLRSMYHSYDKLSVYSLNRSCTFYVEED